MSFDVIDVGLNAVLKLKSFAAKNHELFLKIIFFFFKKLHTAHVEEKSFKILKLISSKIVKDLIAVTSVFASLLRFLFKMADISAKIST